ncbi:MAG: 4-(cytidine 5'-diphospho)-2-C-methyl-D-erythritol kinase [Tannerellaceae bacterium]|nr:4-(cytidine 5'-diphospho)-2-C-methyl-D-erythritol kinase [Tannerellaceae bacterium]MCD8264420.1 4-(cytidine 5'-diphospho)-2-C-methyl-D-erythritol kinase [Tannerellaceae bacterium]
MISFANAKINLGLNIISRRADGYHTIETIFYPIPLKEVIEIVPAREPSFTQTGIPVDGPAENNLILKAIAALQQRYTIPPLEIHLLKAIPLGAGLGGGSADAAVTLKMVNELCELNIPEQELEKIAATLGADCPFFIRNKPVFATGTGNIFTPIDLSLAGYDLYVIKPDIFISTAEAYSAIIPGKPEISLTEIVKRPVTEWKELMVNDFEPNVFKRYPEIGLIKEELYRSGAIYAAMSGSGSSVYGIFKKITEEDAAKMRHKFPDSLVYSLKLR